jgi:hypothetical protein
MRGSLRKLGCAKSTLNKVRVRPLCVCVCVCVFVREDAPLYLAKVSPCIRRGKTCIR